MAVSLKKKLITDVFAVFLFSLVFYIFLLAYITYIDIDESSSALENLITSQYRESLESATRRIVAFIDHDYDNMYKTEFQTMEKSCLYYAEFIPFFPEFLEAGGMSERFGTLGDNLVIIKGNHPPFSPFNYSPAGKEASWYLDSIKGQNRGILDLEDNKGVIASFFKPDGEDYYIIIEKTKYELDARFIRQIPENTKMMESIPGLDFVLGDYSGNLLSGPYAGVNILDWRENSGEKIGQNLIALSRKGGGFYNFFRNGNYFERAGDSINYILPLKNKVIFLLAGFYLDDYNSFKNKEMKKLTDNLHNIIFVSLVLYFIFAAAVLVLLSIVTSRIEKGLSNISSSFIQSMTNLKPIKTKNLAYSNFIKLGEQANEMILQRDLIEKNLKLSRERYVSIFNATNEGIILFDEKLSILDINASALSFFGVEKDNCLKGYINSSYFGIDEYLRGITDFPFGPLVFQRQHNLGDNVFWLENIISGVYFGEEKRILFLSRNISERVRMQNILMETEKMKTVGGLAAGIAHEINNPLGIILQSVENTRRRLSPELKANIAKADELDLDLDKMGDYFEERKIYSYLEYIKEASIRAAEIIKRMLNFSRVSESKMAPADIIDLMERALELAGSDYEMKKIYNFHQVVIEKNYQIDMPLIPLTAAEIEQVFINIIKNAVQAMSDMTMPRLKIEIGTKRDNVEIRIFDNGPQIDSDVRKHMFDPFYTTKEAGTGTGLGLSVSYFIVKNNHKGDLIVENSEEGPVFIITLPLNREDISSG